MIRIWYVVRLQDGLCMNLRPRDNQFPVALELGFRFGWHAPGHGSPFSSRACVCRGLSLEAKKTTSIARKTGAGSQRDFIRKKSFHLFIST